MQNPVVGGEGPTVNPFTHGHHAHCRAFFEEGNAEYGRLTCQQYVTRRRGLQQAHALIPHPPHQAHTPGQAQVLQLTGGNAGSYQGLQVLVLTVGAMTVAAPITAEEATGAAEAVTSDDPGWRYVGLRAGLSAVYLGNGWVGTAHHVATVQHQVDAGEEVAHLGPQFVERAHQRGQMCVGDQPDPH